LVVAFSISGGKKVTGPNDPVTVTIGATLNVDGAIYPNAIGIEFTGMECHVIQIFIRTKIVDGKAYQQNYGKDHGGVNSLEFVDPNSPDWQVDTKSATIPYYDFGYAGRMDGQKFTMADAPRLTGDKYNLPGTADVTTFDAFAFCLSDKEIIAVVKWDLAKNHDGVVTPSASLLEDSAWWDCLSLGRTVLTNKGYNADLYLPMACIN
jgi:hypothetical protein